MSHFKNLTERFAYKSDAKTPTEAVIRRHKQVISKPDRATEIFEKYKDLKPLPDILTSDLNLVFVGYNPSIRSSEVGHRFAHHSNQFWKLIYESGVVDRKLTCYDDFSMLEEYQIGFTELVARPTKSIDEIPKAEMRSSVPSLIKKINHYEPKVLCIVGKGIWEHISQHLKHKKEKFAWGLQEQNSFKCKVVVVPSTSGLVRIPKEDMLKLWRDLKKQIDSRSTGLTT